MTPSVTTRLRALLASLGLVVVVAGIVYPLVVAGIAQAAFAETANGSLVRQNGRTIGSKLVGQSFEQRKYFWGRISATVDANGKPLPYNGIASSGSNLGPANPALVAEVKARIDALHAAAPENIAPVPVDLVTSSASGLDPDISPAAAEYQIPRVAATRGLDDARVRNLVRRHVKERDLGFLGEPRVNVLDLNLALDALDRGDR